MITTILPKNESCSVDKLNMFHMTLGGTCYDKMFSGHFAFGLLSTILAFKHGFMESSISNVSLYALINVIHFWIIAVTRSHYTMDLVVAFYVTMLVTILSKQITW